MLGAYSFPSALAMCDPDRSLRGDMLLAVGREIARTTGSYAQWSDFAAERGMGGSERSAAWSGFGRDPSGADVIEEWARLNGWVEPEPLPQFVPETPWDALRAEESIDYLAGHIVHPPLAPTGIPGLDAALGGGMVAGTYTVIGGEPGAGKTAMAAVAAYHAAASGEYKVIVYSAEIGKMEFYDRLVAVHSRTMSEVFADWIWWSVAHADALASIGRDESMRLWTSGNPQDIERAKAEYMREHGGDDLTVRVWLDFQRTVGRNIVIVSENVTCDGICAQVKELTEQGVHVLPVIDHLHAIQPPEGAGDKEYEAVTATSKALMRLAKSCRCPMLVLSELRNIGENEREEPRLSWYRGSGHVGYDAGTAIVLMQDGEEGDKWRPVAAHIIKNRRGSSGVVVPLTFWGGLNMFDSRVV